MKDAVSGMKSNIELLELLNKELVPEDLLMEQDQESTDDDAPNHDLGGGIEEGVTSVIGPGWPQIQLPSIMCEPQLLACRPMGLGPLIVGQTMIGLMTASSEAPLTQKLGVRGTDTKPRAKRQCTRCLQNKGNSAYSCKGGKAGGKTKCENFHETGELRM